MRPRSAMDTDTGSWPISRSRRVAQLASLLLSPAGSVAATVGNTSASDETARIVAARAATTTLLRRTPVKRAQAGEGRGRALAPRAGAAVLVGEGARRRAVRP